MLGVGLRSQIVSSFDSACGFLMTVWVLLLCVTVSSLWFRSFF